MAYDKHVWQCGEAITTEKLNHMEEGIAEGGGYECEEAYIEVFNETITTESDGSPNSPYIEINSLSITADKIKVTFDGVEYECDAEKTAGIGKTFYMYGSTEVPTPTFENYPFRITSSSENGTRIATKTAGDYDVRIQALGTVATTSECFDTAARKAVNASGKCVKIPRAFVSELEQSRGNPIFPSETAFHLFRNAEAISIAQGQYGTATLVSMMRTNSHMGFAIGGIFVDNGHLPPITNIKGNYDDTAGRATYEVELYARDSAISIGANALKLAATSFELPIVREALCVVEGTCCEEEAPS